jgi:hypothetical protein
VPDPAAGLLCLMITRAAAIVALAILLAGCSAGLSTPTEEAIEPDAAESQTPSSSPTPASDQSWAPPASGEVLASTQLEERLPGYWTGDWGDIVFRIEDDGTVVAAYQWDEGMVVGRLVDDVFIGWWCEVPSRQPDTDAGDVEMRLVEDGTGTHIDGRWRYGSDGTWDEGWDIDAISEDEPPADLVTRLDSVESDCLPH